LFPMELAVNQLLLHLFYKSFLNLQFEKSLLNYQMLYRMVL
jgi:hypothetical protein